MQSWIGTISTVVLVIITAYYAYVTNRMMKYQKEITALDYRPFLVFNNIRYNLGPNRMSTSLKSINIRLNFVNVGRVILEYEIENIELSLDNKKNDNTTYLNKGTYVYPNQGAEFDCGTIDFGGNVPNYIEGRLDYTLIYFSTKDKKYRSRRKLAVYIQPNHNIIEWKSLEEIEEEIS